MKSASSDSTLWLWERCFTCSTACAVRPGSRPVSTTRWPCFASTTAASSPMPFVPPVRRIVFTGPADYTNSAHMLTALTLSLLLGTQMVYDFNVKDIDGKDVKLSQYKGKALLIVNTASECGYTPQYEGLQKLYEGYKAKGFEVLAFPSNDFGGQEPGSAGEIKKFCTLKYKTTFPLFAKVAVKGAK